MLLDLHHHFDNFGSINQFTNQNANHHYVRLLSLIEVPTLLIDISLIPCNDLASHLTNATSHDIRFDQILLNDGDDPILDYESRCRVIDQWCQTNRVKCVLGTSRFVPGKHKNFQEIIYPNWFFSSGLRAGGYWQPIARGYAFSCLNRNPAPHRLLLYSLLKHHNLLKDFIFSFNNQRLGLGRTVTPEDYRSLAEILPLPVFRQTIQDLQDMPIAWNNETLGANDHSTAHDAYQNAWCNVVTETSTDHAFVSEKIWKPISAGQLFLVLGSPGTCAWLKQIGFETFESDYDDIANLYNRTQRIIDIVKHNHNAESWWHQQQDAVRHNFEWFRSKDLENLLITPAIEALT